MTSPDVTNDRLRISSYIHYELNRALNGDQEITKIDDKCALEIGRILAGLLKFVNSDRTTDKYPQ